METVGLLFFGAAVGVLSGVLGIGGGIVLVPGLMILFGFTQPEAQGTSLAVLSVPVVIFAALVYHQNGFVRLPVMGVIVVGFAVGAYCGARLVPHVPVSGLRLGFGTLLLYVGLLFAFDIRSTRSFAALPAGVAAVLMAVLGRFLRRRFPRRPLPAPTPTATEYHS
jgi:uncharacterized membrane protein YfcA